MVLGLQWYRPPGSFGTARTRAGTIGIDRATACRWRAQPIARWHILIDPYFQFEFKTTHSIEKLVIFDRLSSISEKVSLQIFAFLFVSLKIAIMFTVRIA
jgi:hypothetical protein